MPKVDVRVTYHGTIYMVEVVTPAAQAWVNDNLELESWQWMGGSFAVEPRMMDNLLDGMREDGLRL